MAFLVLSDDGSRVLAINPDEVSTTVAFRAEVERNFGYDRLHTSVCPIQPRLTDLSISGQACKSVVAVTQMRLQPPPSAPQLSPPLHVVFLDARLLLQDLRWVTAAEGFLEVPAVLEPFQRDAPLGFSVEATGVPTEILDGSDYFRAPHGSCLRLTCVQDSSVVGSSNGNTGDGPPSDKEEASESSSDSAPSASTLDAASRPKEGPAESGSRERSRSRTRGGTAHGTRTRTDVLLAGTAVIHAATAVPVSSAMFFPPTVTVLQGCTAVEQLEYHLWCAVVGFGLLLLAGFIVGALSRKPPTPAGAFR